MPQTNPKRTFYAINSDAGAFTVIRLTSWAKYVEITEDPNYNAGAQQGLQYNALDPFALSTNITANAEPAPPAFAIALAAPVGTPQITFGDKHNVHSGTSAPLGNPGSAGNTDSPGTEVPTLGTPLAQVRTNSATAGGIVVVEYV